MAIKIKVKDIKVHNSSNYVKRRNGLQKKLHELSVLCGIDACIICFSDASSSCVLDISPHDTNYCLSLCERYLGLDKSEREKKRQDCSHFLWEKIHSLKQQIEKKREENMEAKLEAMVYGFSGHHRNDELSIDDIQKQLSGHIDV
ncbi:agamous-like MADS-box protein AGL36 [Amborella trichopoda]|uniref:agamous-like MADS-box protein AGL36 n=1 Tax=Amborella trichopoda TaxID=13333 RepID=UPI0005D355C9|nr:agamous-like MADS-box protein AGL36 [Amborella trichopoda]|eukprot:XP_011624398.1 agamous-like MADS-box protein AGL36 [Amborella trichopoda]